MALNWEKSTPFYSLCCGIYANKIFKCDLPSENKEITELLEVIKSYLEYTNQDDIEKLIANLFRDRGKTLLDYYIGNKCYENKHKVPAMQNLFLYLLSHLNNCTLSQPPLPGILRLRENAALLLGEDHSALVKLNQLKEPKPDRCIIS